MQGNQRRSRKAGGARVPDIMGSAGMMSKNISAVLRAGSNGSYSGTYNGVNGSASLSGRRKGNTIVLAVRGKKPATMSDGIRPVQALLRSVPRINTQRLLWRSIDFGSLF